MAVSFVGGNPYTDPEANNVTDGSVDYYDFDWGEPVYYPEEEMEPELFNCDAATPGGVSACGDNIPAQTDELAYDVIDV